MTSEIWNYGLILFINYTMISKLQKPIECVYVLDIHMCVRNKECNIITLKKQIKIELHRFFFTWAVISMLIYFVRVLASRYART